jgi:hypothetical protein
MADTVLDPRAVFALVRERWLANGPGVDARLLAEDAVVEFPFALPGRPARFEGREQFLDFARPEQAALGVRFENIRDVVIHDTSDPEVIVAEYVMAGTLTASGQHAAAAFVSVLRVRAGRIVHWREYQNPVAMAAVAVQ